MRILRKRNQKADICSVLEKEFDTDFYLSKYPDIRQTGADPIEHYITIGWKEGRDPSQNFSTSYYLKNNPDVQQEKENPFFHYIVFGRKEGRSPVPSESEQPPSRANGPDYQKETIQKEFDIHFFRSQYPEFDDGELDPIQFYLDVGWKEGVDPSPAFSTDYYLDNNPDVAQSDVNPFFHYLVHGRLEGRPSRNSLFAELKESEDIETNGDHRTPRCAVISLVKNEADIVELFSSHLIALFDSIVFVDHGSEDGTLEFLQELENSRRDVSLYHLAEPGYIQGTVMNHLIRTAKELQDLDWIFFLDADEFLPFSSKDEFSTSLNKYRNFPVISLNWKNLIPENYWDFKVQLDRRFHIPKDTSPYQKIAFQPKKLCGRDFWVEQGNHNILKWPGGSAKAAKGAFHIWHLPVRSVNQLSLKLTQGVASYLRSGKSRNEAEGTHWFHILNSLEGADITDARLNKVIHSYGEEKPDISPLPAEELCNQGYTKCLLKIATAPLVQKIEVPLNIASLIFKVNGALAAQEDSEIGGRPILALETCEGRVLKRATDDHGFRFKRLPALRDDDSIFNDDLISDNEFLNELLRPSYWEIQQLPPSAWSGHIPFMFSFTSMFKPRFFTELGTHHGASFLAFAQAANRSYLETKAVAVDTWQGDEHTGYYDDRVFDNFTWRLNEYDAFASYLRMRFDNAVKLFEDGSIDLLHIDGLHTYEAVRHDFETWLPKLTERGTVFFHDINVHERDFGVWQFWREIEERYPTIQFYHSHGLGVAYVGTATKTKMERLFGILNEDAVVRAMVQHHFETIAEKSVEIFNTNFRLKQLDQQVSELGRLNERNAKLEQEIMAIKEQSCQIDRLASEFPPEKTQ